MQRQDDNLLVTSMIFGLVLNCSFLGRFFFFLGGGGGRVVVVLFLFGWFFGFWVFFGDRSTMHQLSEIYIKAS